MAHSRMRLNFPYEGYVSLDHIPNLHTSNISDEYGRHDTDIFLTSEYKSFIEKAERIDGQVRWEIIFSRKMNLVSDNFFSIPIYDSGFKNFLSINNFMKLISADYPLYTFIVVMAAPINGTIDRLYVYTRPNIRFIRDLTMSSIRVNFDHAEKSFSDFYRHIIPFNEERFHESTGRTIWRYSNKSTNNMYPLINYTVNLCSYTQSRLDIPSTERNYYSYISTHFIYSAGEGFQDFVIRKYFLPPRHQYLLRDTISKIQRGRMIERGDTRERRSSRSRDRDSRRGRSRSRSRERVRSVPPPSSGTAPSSPSREIHSVTRPPISILSRPPPEISLSREELASMVETMVRDRMLEELSRSAAAMRGGIDLMPPPPPPPLPPPPPPPPSEELPPPPPPIHPTIDSASSYIPLPAAPAIQSSHTSSIVSLFYRKQP